MFPTARTTPWLGRHACASLAARAPTGVIRLDRAVLQAAPAALQWGVQGATPTAQHQGVTVRQTRALAWEASET